jgi:protein-serine/threonine kinase
MSDLLPPSPSVVHPAARLFIPSPSHLAASSASMTYSEKQSDERQRSSTIDTARVSALNIARSSSPTSYEDYEVDHDDRGATFLTDSGPIIRPLDYSVLMVSGDHTNEELARTVDDLSQWMSVVQSGFSSLLDINETVIEEEEIEEPLGDLSFDPDLSHLSFPQQNSYFPITPGNFIG